jgi:hypothetical protein
MIRAREVPAASAPAPLSSPPTFASITPPREAWLISDPAEAEERAEPAEAKEPMEKAEKAEPTEQMEQTEPTDPMERIEPSEAMERRELVGEGERAPRMRIRLVPTTPVIWRERLSRGIGPTHRRSGRSIPHHTAQIAV